MLIHTYLIGLVFFFGFDMGQKTCLGTEYDLAEWTKATFAIVFWPLFLIAIIYDIIKRK